MNLQRTKYKGIYFLENKDGSRSYYIRYSANGRRVKKLAGHTITEARNLQADIKDKKIRGEWALATSKKGVRFEDLAAKYLEDLEQRTEKKQPRVASCIKKLNAEFGMLWAHMIDEESIDAAHLPRQELIYLKAILHKGRRWKYFQDVPEIHVADSSKRIDCAVTDEHLRKILDLASPLLRDAVLLCLNTGGMRLGELVKITRDNTDFEARTITLQERKADVPKVYALTSAAAAILRRRFLENGGRAFTEPAGKLSQMFFYERQHMKAQGVKDWVFHGLRHTVSGYLRGVDARTIQAVYGHTDLNTTARYMHSTLDDERRALEMIGEHLGQIAAGGDTAKR